MGFFSPDDNPDLRIVTGAKPPEPEYPTAWDAASSAFLQDNTIVSTLANLRNSQVFVADPNHNPMSVIRDTPFEQYHADRFLGSRSEAETRSIMSTIEREKETRKTHEASGGMGVIMSMVAGGADPTIFMPGTVAVRAGQAGWTFTRAAVGTGAAAALQTGLQETVLHATKETRTLGESAVNIGSATILAGLLGGAAARLLSPEEHAAAVASLDKARADMNAHAAGPSPSPGAGVGTGADAGAAVADTRELKLVSAGGIEKLTKGFDPMSRLLNSGSVSARRAAVDLAETPLRFQENERGVATSQGPSIERLARNAIDQTRVQVSDEFSRLFAEYRFNDADISIPRLRSQFESFMGRGEGYMTFDDFKSEISRALIEGDKHENPFVQQAAQFVRRTVFEPWKERAIAAKLLPEDVNVKTAESYFQRVYDKTKMAAQRPVVVDRFTEWLLSDQTAKAAAKERLTLYQGSLDVSREQIAKIEKQIETRQATVDQLRVRQEEVRRFNQFAFQRSADMSEPLEVIRAQIRRVEDRIGPQLEEMENLRQLISEQKDLNPQIREAERRLRRLSEVSQQMRAARDAVETVDAASNYADELTGIINDFRAELREASARVTATRIEARQLTALENARDDLNVVLRPYQKQLRRLRKDLREERAERIQKAQGGAVFETEIRNRGNTLADRASGKDAEIDALEQRLAEQVANHDAMRAKIEDEIGRWEGSSSVEAKSALRSRAKAEADRAAKQADGSYAGKGERLSSADAAIDATVRRILNSNRDLSDAELRDVAQEIFQRIMGSPDGRLGYEAGMAHASRANDARGPLAARVFNIPDAMIRDFLDQDVEHVVNVHLKSIIPDVLMTERFGDTRMTEVIRKIESDYGRLADAATSDKQRKKINDERESAIRDVAAIRDRIKGTYGSDYYALMPNMARAAAAVKQYNVITSMGVAAISSFNDMAGVIYRHGLTTTYREAWDPFLRSLMGDSEGWRAAREQMRAMGIATETFTSSRANAISDIMDSHKPQSRVERSLQWGSNRFQLVSMLAQWTDWGKTVAGTVAMAEILKAVEAVAKGTATKRQITNLAESSIDAALARRIHAQYTIAGSKVDGVRLANTADWTDRGARDALEGAIGREADIAVITPGQEKSLWLSNPVLGVVGQFKSFTAAATQRTLIANLQRRDAQVLQGLLFSLGLGMISYKANSLLGGQKTSDRPQDWIKEGISRSGMLGWFEEGNAIASKLTRGGADIHRLYGADKPLSRYASRSAVDALLGPTAGKIGKLAQVTGSASSGEWTSSDTRALRTLVAGQNLFWLRGVLNEVEEGVNGAFGIPMKAPN